MVPGVILLVILWLADAPRVLLAFGLAVLATVALAGCAAPAYLPNGPDTVPNAISCQFRGASFCHPKLIDV